MGYRAPWHGITNKMETQVGIVIPNEFSAFFNIFNSHHWSFVKMLSSSLYVIICMCFEIPLTPYP
jgi:hypothetical protein